MAQKTHIASIREFHQVAGILPPSCTSLSVLRLENLQWKPSDEKTTIVRDFYIIAWKKDINTKFRYGQKDMDITSGSLHFMAPKQVLTIDAPAGKVTNKGWLLLIHRDFLWNTSLARKIRLYEFFNYDFNQVLALKAEEEQTIICIFKQVEKEQHQLGDSNTRDVVLAQIELLLAYAERYYRIRKASPAEKQENTILAQLEVHIDQYLQGSDLLLKGIPSIKYLSDKLYVSPNYLSRLVQGLTGQSTQHFLHDKLMTLAREKISTTSFSISEIAYQLGFRSPQSFSRLFKVKTNQTPTQFRNKFRADE